AVWEVEKVWVTFKSELYSDVGLVEAAQRARNVIDPELVETNGEDNLRPEFFPDGGIRLHFRNWIAINSPSEDSYEIEKTPPTLTLGNAQKEFDFLRSAFAADRPIVVGYDSTRSFFAVGSVLNSFMSVHRFGYQAPPITSAPEAVAFNLRSFGSGDCLFQQEL